MQYLRRRALVAISPHHDSHTMFSHWLTRSLYPRTYFVQSQLTEALAQHRVLVVIGETGSGKTTQMTQYMSEMG